MDGRTPNILEVKSLQKTYSQDLLQKKRQVLKNVSFHFPRGRCVALMGHNGAGKTSTIRAIFGLIQLDKGEVLFDGHPISKKDRSRIGYMPETNKLPMTLTCEELLRMELRLYSQNLPARQVRAAVDAKLMEVGLAGHGKQRIDRLSKGMGRRLAWAQATIHQPELLILDEPFSGLDPYGRQQMVKWIRELKGRKTSIIICGHEWEMLQQVCDDFHVLKQGELVFSTLESGFARHEGGLYHLTLSGTDDEEIRILQERHKLPHWQGVTKERYLVGLRFSHYPDAARWLSASLEAGHVLVSFEEKREMDEQTLMRFFSLGEQV